MNRVNGSTTVSVSKKASDQKDYRLARSSHEDAPEGATQRTSGRDAVRFSQGRTINLGDFEYARIAASYSAQGAPPQLLEAGEAVVREILEREVAAATSQEREQGPLEAPEGAEAQTVGIDYGLTVNLGNYESAKVDVGITVPVGDGEELAAAVGRLQGQMTARVESELEKLRGLSGGGDIGI